MQRINLIEKERLNITYGLLLASLATAIVICLAITGLQWLTTYQHKNRIGRLNLEIQALKTVREKLISHEGLAKGTGAMAEIQNTFKKTPSWAKLLRTIAQILPPNTWFTSLKSQDLEGTPPKKSLTLNGQAKNPQEINQFRAQMERMSSFENIVLTTSKEEAGGLFHFTIACDIRQEGAR